jgi:TonB family protein
VDYTDEVVPPSGNVQSNVVYPGSALLDSLEGTVVVRALVGPTGMLQNVEVVEATDTVFNAAAVSAVWATNFQPAYDGANPVEASLEIPVKFELSSNVVAVDDSLLQISARDGLYNLTHHPMGEDERLVHPAYELWEIESQNTPVGIQAQVQKNCVYPDSALQNNIEGRVIVAGLVDRSGHVIHTKILGSSNPIFNQAAAAAMRESTFSPGYVDGVAVNFKIVVPLHFKLNDNKHN